MSVSVCPRMVHSSPRGNGLRSKGSRHRQGPVGRTTGSVTGEVTDLSSSVPQVRLSWPSPYVTYDLSLPKTKQQQLLQKTNLKVTPKNTVQTRTKSKYKTGPVTRTDIGRIITLSKIMYLSVSRGHILCTFHKHCEDVLNPPF